MSDQPQLRQYMGQTMRFDGNVWQNVGPLPAELRAIAEEMEADLTENVLTVDWIERIRAIAARIEQ